MNDWSSSIYWYQYRPTYFVMQDLKHGDGLPPPANHPRYQIIYQVANISDDVDLARVALDELLRRDKAGTLPEKYRQQIDEYALADLSRPATTAAVQPHLDDELVRRLAAGKLTEVQKSAIFQNALATTLTVDPIVMRRDALPLQITFSRDGPLGMFSSAVLKSVRMDGREAHWIYVPDGTDPASVDLDLVEKVVEKRWLSDPGLGDHQIDLDILLDGTESRKLMVRFTEIEPTPAVKLFRFVCHPIHEGVRYLRDEALLEMIADTPDYFSNLAALEIIRRHRIGELSDDANRAFIEEILRIQGNPAKAWDKTYGDYLEAMKSAGKLTDEQWRQYGKQQVQFVWRGPASIVEGEPLRLDLVLLPLRGDSKDHDDSLDNLDYSFAPDPGENWQLIGLGQADLHAMQKELTIPYVAKCANVHAGRHWLSARFINLEINAADNPPQLKTTQQYDVGEFSFDIVPGAASIPSTTLEKASRFVSDPLHEVLRYLPGEALLEMTTNASDYFSNLAALEMIRRHWIGGLSGRINHAFVDQLLEIQRNRARAWDTAYGDYIEALQAGGELSDKQWRQYVKFQFLYWVRAPGEIVAGTPLRLDLVVLRRRGDSPVAWYPERSWSIQCTIAENGAQTWQAETLADQKDFLPPEAHPEYVVPLIVRYSNVRPGRHTARVKVKLTDTTSIERPQQMEIPAEYDLGELSFEVLPRGTPGRAK